MATSDEEIARYLATRGPARVPEGEGALNHMTRRDWRRVVTGADGVEHVMNGLGEWIA